MRIGRGVNAAQLKTEALITGFVLLLAGGAAHAGAKAVSGMYLEAQTTYSAAPKLNFSTRMYADGGNDSRIEMRRADGHQSIILNRGKRSWVLDVAHKAAFAIPVDQVSNASTPCQGEPNATCRIVGSAILLGRKAVIYDVVERRVNLPWNERLVRDRHSVQWVDAQTGVPLKVVYDDGERTEVKKIRFAAQPPALFTVPTGYRKMQ